MRTTTVDPERAERRTVSAQRLLVLLTVVGTAAIFWRVPLDNFALPKWSFALLTITAAIAVGVIRIVRTARISLPRSWFVLVCALFVAGLVVATVTSSHLPTSILGQRGRYTGLIGYCAYVCLALITLRVYTPRTLVPLVRGLMLASGFVAVYSIVQMMGLDPAGWRGFSKKVFSTMGNPNFAAAYMGIVIPVALWHALEAQASRPWRVYSWLLVVVSAVGVYGTHALQGPVVVFASFGLVVLVVLHQRFTWVRRLLARRWLVWPSVAAAATGAAAAFVANIDALRPLLGAGFRQRLFMWESAVAAFRDRWFLGHGLDTYGDVNSSYQSAASAAEFGYRVPDAPHSVPLNMFVSGGVVLGVLYLAVVVYVGITLVRGLRRTTGSQQRFLAALGGGWLGYQVQSLISIDEPELAILHWVLAAAIVVFVERPTLRTWTLPWRRLARPRVTLGDRRRLIPRQSPRAVIRWATYGVVALMLAAWVPVTQPIRADMHAATAVRYTAAGRFAEVEDAFRRAQQLNPWDGRYWAEYAEALDAEDRPDDALAAQIEAARRAPGWTIYARNAALLAQKVDPPRSAAVERWYDEALARNPRHVDLLVEIASYYVARDEPGDARPYLESAAELDPGDDRVAALLEYLQRRPG